MAGRPPRTRSTNPSTSMSRPQLAHVTTISSVLTPRILRCREAPEALLVLGIRPIMPIQSATDISGKTSDSSLWNDDATSAVIALICRASPCTSGGGTYHPQVLPAGGCNRDLHLPSKYLLRQTLQSNLRPLAISDHPHSCQMHQGGYDPSCRTTANHGCYNRSGPTGHVDRHDHGPHPCQNRVVRPCSCPFLSALGPGRPHGRDLALWTT